ncbi:MAG: HD domain-containing protein [Butyrivibrio sp.]|nr:HD domain-containing protein [Butyrivibrio sp.]
MKKIKVKDAAEGETLAEVIMGKSGSVLLYEGAVLNSEHISKLIDNNIEEICIRDDVVKESILYTIETIEKDSVVQIKDAVHRRLRMGEDSDFKIIEETAVNIIKNVVNNVDVASCMVDIKRNSGELYSHMLNVASLSAIMGIKEGFSEHQLRCVTEGALLHDIGLTKVTVPYENVEMDTMPAADKLNYRKHVISGYQMLQSFKWMEEMTKLIVLSHHERMNGSGYPFHKTEERLTDEVKLVAICDHFDELVNGIGYERHKVYEVVEYFRTNGAALFDYRMTTGIMNDIAWFPNGSTVLTNEGEVALILGQNHKLPDRPIIKVLRTSDGQECTEEVIKDLTEHLTVFIIDTID